eukprot:scaffold1506_cov179-Amphora_coffeaeformis.AAC.28
MASSDRNNNNAAVAAAAASTGQPTDVLDEGARIYGWTTLFLKRVLPATFQQKHFHFKRKTDRPIKEGTIFLTELAKNIKVPLQERKKDELVQVLVDRLATMPLHEIPVEIMAQIPPNPWSMIKAKDKTVEDELTMATVEVTKEELMGNFQDFPESFLELVHHLRENALWPDDSKVVVWMGAHIDSIFILNRSCILRALAKQDTKRWNTLPAPFSDADLPEFDADLGPPPTLGLGGISPMKRKKVPVGSAASGGGLATGSSRGHKSSGGTGKNNSGTGADIVAAALNFVGTQQQTQSKRTSTETVVYWKQKEDIERENAKRARIDSEVHRFKVLEDILPTLEDAATRDELHHELQQQKAQFCRHLLQQQQAGGKKKQSIEEGDGGGDASVAAPSQD